MLDEKKMLIDSMKKLIVHISNNKEHQNDIYRSLTKNDIVKIISNLYDTNVTLRKMSARLLCYLLYDNDELKELFMQTMNIVPSHGNIVLNKFPDAMTSRPEVVLEITKYLKGARLPHSNEKEICWFIDADRSDTTFQTVTHSTFAIHYFLDPSRVLFGIAYQKNEPTKSKPTYPDFSVNFNQLSASTQLAAEKRSKIRSDGISYSMTGGYTDRYINLNVSHDIDKMIRSSRYDSSLNRISANGAERPRKYYAYTYRFYRPSEYYSRYSIANGSAATNMSGMQSHIVGKRINDESIGANRVRTDESDSSFLRGRPKQGLKLLAGTNITSTSPQSAQPYSSKIIDKVLKDKANNKDEKQVIVLGGTKETHTGGYKSHYNSTLTDRDPRYSFEGTTPKSIQGGYLIKGSYTGNTYGRELVNNYTPTSDIRDSRRPQQTTHIESRPTHYSSFEGGYRPSEIFLKKIKDSTKK